MPWSCCLTLRWCNDGACRLSRAPSGSSSRAAAACRPLVLLLPLLLTRVTAGAGMSLEDSQMVVESMAQTGVEPTYCMGDDIPLPVLSDKPHILYNYFKQRFAQVGARHRASG
jgi:hypothetical protein